MKDNLKRLIQAVERRYLTPKSGENVKKQPGLETK
jgi:hypothetical protein